jgi:hypothetical protein
MILVDETDQPRPIADLSDAKQIKNFWLYDFQKGDFILTPLTTIVELRSSSLTIEAYGNFVHLPVDWYTIVVDKMTGTVDTIQTHELTNTNFRLLVTGPKIRTITEIGYRVVNFDHIRTFYHPIMTKHQMLCIAVSPSKWVFATPNDLYQKYLKHASPGDFLM